MKDPRLDDHLAGLEQELVELVERRTRAQVQGRDEDAAAFAEEIDAVQAELVATAEEAAAEAPEPRARVMVDPVLAAADSPPTRGHPGRWSRLRRTPLKHA